MRLSLIVILVLFCETLFAAQRNLITVGQGIASPAITHSLFYSNGGTPENPVGIAFQNGVKITGVHIPEVGNSNNSASGAELGFGNGTMGLAGGVYQVDCDNCDSEAYGGFGILFGNAVGFGMSGTEDVYSAGLSFNPKGDFTVAFTASYFDFGDDGLDYIRAGAGLGFSGNNWTFVVDASKIETDEAGIDNKTVTVTPGLKIHVDFIHFSANVDMYVNEPEGTNSDDDFWFGIGFGNGDPFNITLYHEMNSELGIVGSFFF